MHAAEFVDLERTPDPNAIRWHNAIDQRAQRNPSRPLGAALSFALLELVGKQCQLQRGGEQAVAVPLEVAASARGHAKRPSKIDVRLQPGIKLESPLREPPAELRLAG